MAIIGQVATFAALRLTCGVQAFPSMAFGLGLPMLVAADHGSIVAP